MGSHVMRDAGSGASRIDSRKIALFLGLAFGISWTGAVAFSLSGIELETLTGVEFMLTVFMWAPAIAAIVTQLRYGESIREGCGLAVGRLRWVALAWLTPVALVGATIGVGTLRTQVDLMGWRCRERGGS